MFGYSIGLLNGFDLKVFSMVAPLKVEDIDESASGVVFFFVVSFYLLYYSTYTSLLIPRIVLRFNSRFCLEVKILEM